MIGLGQNSAGRGRQVRGEEAGHSQNLALSATGKQDEAAVQRLRGVGRVANPPDRADDYSQLGPTDKLEIIPGKARVVV